MLQERGFGETLVGVPTAGIERSSTVELVTPSDRVIVPHAASLVGAFIEGRQYVNIATGIAAVCIPLITSLPAHRQMPGRWMHAIGDNDGCVLNSRMRLEVCADKPAVPRPIVFGVGRSVNAQESAAASNVTLERCLLIVVEDVAGRVQKYDCTETGEIGIRKRTGVFGRFDGKSVSLAEPLDRLNAGWDRRVAEPSRLAEDEHVQRRRFLNGRRGDNGFYRERCRATAEGDHLRDDQI